MAPEVIQQQDGYGRKAGIKRVETPSMNNGLFFTSFTMEKKAG